MRKIGFVLVMSLIASTAMAGSSLFGGHKAKTVNTDGVHSIGVHICGSLECPPIRIFEGKCDKDHMSMHWGVCVCDKGYVPKDGKCDACPEGQFSDGIHNCQICPEGKYIAHTGDTTCTKCPDGYYCVGGQKYACPDYATCTASSFECNEGFTTSLKSCTCPVGKYIDGGICKSCPSHATCDGKNFTCGDGYDNGDNVCVCGMGKSVDKDTKICQDCPTYSDCTADECCELTGSNDACGNKTPVYYGFKDNAGSCVKCSYSDYYGVRSVAEECAKCDKTSTPRIMIDGFCYLKQDCGKGRFQVWDGCQDCSTNGYYASTTDECAKCDKTATPRIMIDNVCYKKQDCGEGQFQATDGCRDCSYAYGATSTAEECAKCDTTSTPRVMMGAACYKKEDCGEGQFQTTDGCSDCSYAYGVTSTAEECAKCDTTATPREIFKEITDYHGRELNVCALPCPDGQIHDDYGNCQDCSDEYAFYYISDEECAKCGTARKSISYPYGNYKICVKSCDDGEIMDIVGNCYPCDNEWSIEATETECAKCGDKRISANYVYNGRTEAYLCEKSDMCEDNEFMAEGGCFSCDEEDGFITSAAACAMCGDKRKMITDTDGDERCALADCGDGKVLDYSYRRCRACDDVGTTTESECNKCDNHFFVPDDYYGVDLGYCAPCSENWSSETTEEQCNRCKTSPTPRKFFNGTSCALDVECSTNQFRLLNGECRDCSSNYIYSTYPATSEECGKCPTEREMFGDQCLYLCNDNQFRSEDGRCRDCSENKAYATTSTECGKCSTEREMIDGKCYPACTGESFRDTSGGCHLCSSNTSAPATETECARCNSTVNKREMIEGSCYSVCGDNEFHGQDGVCTPCLSTDSYNIRDYLCAECDGTSTPRRIFEWLAPNPYPFYEKRSACGLLSAGDKTFHDMTGKWYSCDDNSTNIITDASQCYSCGNRYLKESTKLIDHGYYCYLCPDDKATACDNAGKSTACVEDYEVKAGVCIYHPDCDSTVGGYCEDNSTVCPGYYCSIAGGTTDDGQWCGSSRYNRPSSGTVQALGAPTPKDGGYLSSPASVASWDAAVNYCNALKTTIEAAVTVNGVDYSGYDSVNGLVSIPSNCYTYNTCSTTFPDDGGYWANSLAYQDCGSSSSSIAVGSNFCLALLVHKNSVSAGKRKYSLPALCK